MTIRQRLKAAAEELRAAGVPDPEYDSAMLLARVTGKPHLALRLAEEELGPEAERRFSALMARRIRREPLQYLLGSAVFCGMEFRVGPGVLIPRPETELLAEWALSLLSGRTRPRILDLCCGSGCLGLTMQKRLPEARVTLTDLSPEALRITEENRARLGLECRILEGDLFAPVAGEQFECILSNPPYIPSGECGGLQAEVLREPRMALDGGADGLDFYRRITAEAPGHLTPGGLLMMEAGFGQAAEIARLAVESGAARTEIRRDDAGLERMVLAEYA